MTSQSAKNACFARRGRVAVGARGLERLRARPHQHVHAERASIAGDHAADAAVAIDAEGFVAQRRADADLPFAGFERRHLLRNLAHGREDQSPGHFGGGVGRRAGVLARGDDDAEARAGVDIDVRIDAALADQLELGQALEQRRADLGPLADQHQRFGIAQPFRQRVNVLHMVVPDGNVLSRELAEAGQGAQRVVVIVEDGDFHRAGRSHFTLWHFRGPPAQAGKTRIIPIKRDPFAVPLDGKRGIPGVGDRRTAGVGLNA